MLTELVKVLTNPIVTGLSASAVLGSIMFTLRDIPKTLFSILKEQVTTSVTISSMDPSYKCIEKWLSTKTFLMTPRTSVLKSIDSEDGDDCNWQLTLGDGTHYLIYNNIFVAVTKTVKDSEKVVHGTPNLEELTITLLTRNTIILESMIRDAYLYSNFGEYVKVYTYSNWWAKIRDKRVRKIDSLIFNSGIIELIMADVDKFIVSSDWYDSIGMPYRRGYLFSGPPGTGKTSLVFALASHYKRPIFVLSISPAMRDCDLIHMVSTTCKDAIILIEDVDTLAVSNNRTEEASNEPQTGVTKAGLLNILDGITTPDNRIFVMTTNRCHYLDEALIRPGRVDLHVVIDNLDAEAQGRMAAKFNVHDYVTSSVPVSPATLQQTFVRISSL